MVRLLHVGDRAARRVWKQVVEAAAIGAINVAHLYSPQAIVVGGGVGRAGDLLLEPLRTHLRRHGPPGLPIEVVGAALGDDAGLAGRPPGGPRSGASRSPPGAPPPRAVSPAPPPPRKRWQRRLGHEPAVEAARGRAEHLADFLRRGLITGGGLERLMREDAVSGVTSNPTIFAKAIGGSTDYDDIRQLADKGAGDPVEIFYDLALSDVAMAADVFRPRYDETGGADGFVSFELEAGLAHDTTGSIAAARELFQRIGKPNVMIKVPGTPEGVPTVEELTALGVNVNITLLFSVDLYEQAALDLGGLERRLEAGQPLDRVTVASVFVSRIDTAADALLPQGSPLRGRAAIANAKEAYQRFRRLFAGPRWERLAAAGARVQRPLWASAGTKNPAYSDVLYVEELVGPDTVNTMPEATLDAFRGTS